MTDEVAFLRAIINEPAEDAARLIYADWLDDHPGAVECPVCPPDEGEGLHPSDLICTRCYGSREASNGNAERAEFIRLQCDTGPADATMRLWELLHHSRPWFAAARKPLGMPADCWGVQHDRTIAFEPKIGPVYFYVRRGFVHTVRGPLDDLRRHLPIIRLENPVEAVEVSDKRPFDAFADVPAMFERDMTKELPDASYITTRWNRLPAEVFDELEGGEFGTYYIVFGVYADVQFESVEAANTALSNVLLKRSAVTYR